MGTYIIGGFMVQQIDELTVDEVKVIWHQKNWDRALELSDIVGEYAEEHQIDAQELMAYILKKEPNLANIRYMKW